MQKSGRQLPNQQSIVNTTNKTNINQVTWWKQQRRTDVPANGRRAMVRQSTTTHCPNLQRSKIMKIKERWRNCSTLKEIKKKDSTTKFNEQLQSGCFFDKKL